jgi:low affinity Fe/Cu permease
MANHKKHFFEDFSRQTACWAGSPGIFIIALTIIILWILSGPLFAYSDTWQLVINTAF